MRDMGEEFQNNVMGNIADLLGIQLNRTTAYKPFGNGAMERIHRTINAIFVKVVDGNQKNWYKLTPFVTLAYNTSNHSSTAFSPFDVLHLREARIPIDLSMENFGESIPADWNDYVMQIRRRM